MGVYRYGAGFILFLQESTKNGWVQVDPPSPYAQTGMKCSLGISVLKYEADSVQTVRHMCCLTLIDIASVSLSIVWEGKVRTVTFFLISFRQGCNRTIFLRGQSNFFLIFSRCEMLFPSRKFPCW